MKKNIFILIITIFSVFIISCGSSDDSKESKSLGEYLPVGGEITGWDENTLMGEEGIETTTDLSVATYWVNGAMDRYTKTGGWVSLAREFYTNGEIKISLFIYEMSNKEKASTVFTELEDYTGVNWQDFEFGGGENNGRFGIIHTYAYTNATKGKYLVETQTMPETAEAQAKSFCKTILERLP